MAETLNLITVMLIGQKITRTSFFCPDNVKNEGLGVC